VLKLAEAASFEVLKLAEGVSVRLSATTSLRPTVRWLEERLFQAISFTTVVLKLVAILASVSPRRTVYVVVLAEVLGVDLDAV